MKNTEIKKTSKLSLELRGTDKDAIAELKKFLKESGVSILREPIYFGDNTLAFQDGVYHFEKDKLIIEIISSKETIEILRKNLSDIPTISIE